MSLGKDFFNSYSAYKNFFNINCSHTGSNSWVVSGEKSGSGKPILANDVHLGFQAPSKWYEVHLKSKDVDVSGMSIPGAPAVVIGHNKFIAWGVTNLMNDDTDFFILESDSSDYLKYKYQNQSYFLDSLVEKISVKDSAEINFTIKYTKTGPVISELKSNFQEQNANKNKLLTFKWTGFEISDEFYALYKINIARNWDEFKSGLKDFGVPAQNFIYADVNGNIGYHAAGKIPVRKTNIYSDFIFPSAGEPDWISFIDFDKLPNVFNPKEGLIVTANTNPFDWLKSDEKNRYYISYIWETSSRFDKIRGTLMKKANLNLSEFKLLQMNYESLYAKEISKFVIAAFKDYKINDSRVISILDEFKNWNGEMNADESIGAVYSSFFIELLKNIYLDELGEKIFQDFLNVGNLPLRAAHILLNRADSGWFDDVNTSNIETRDEIIRKSFLGAVEFLKTKYNNSAVNSWRWGEIHKVKFKHPMGIVPALERTFNIGPYEVGGDQTTVNNSEYGFYEAYKYGEFDNTLGPSMRMIVDLSDIRHSYSVNTTGQSGQP
ncbi:MAG: penicillin acylase family protein, partial [Ignavibacteria bacterium]